MKKRFFIILYLLIPVLSFSQDLNINVTGKVMNSATGFPLSGATVNVFTDSSCNSFSASAITDSNGVYNLNFVSPTVNQCGIYGYTQSCNGMLVNEQSWYGNAQTTVKMNFQLACSPNGSCYADFTLTRDSSGLVFAINQSYSQTGRFSSTWTVDGVKKSVQNSPYFVLMEGNHDICLCILDSTGCSSLVCDTIYVQANSRSSQSVFSYQISDIEDR